MGNITSIEREWVKALFLSHAELMYKTAAYRLRDEDRAHDLVQDVFLLLIVKLEQVRDYDNPAGWLFETLNRSIQAEARLRAAHYALDLHLDEAFHAIPAPAEDEPLLLGEVLPAGLREKDREILLLFFEEGLSHREIAQRLNITEGTSYTRLCRAKERCKERMEEEKKNNFENV